MMIIFSSILDNFSSHVLDLNPSSIKNFVNNNLNSILNYTSILSSLKSRVVGTNGYYQSYRYIYNFMKNFSDHVYLQNFTLAMPIGSFNLTYIVNGKAYHVKLYTILPNGFSLGVQGKIEGEIIYVGTGEINTYKDKDIGDKIILIDFDSGINWLRYGCTLSIPKAFIFIEPYEGETQSNSSLPFTRKDVDGQYISVPINVPRFFVKYNDIKNVLIALDKGEKVIGKICGKDEWKLVNAFNIIGYIKGKTITEESIIIAAHYDSYSIIPELSPGADESLGISLMLLLMKYFRENRPNRSILFVALSGHWEGIAGARIFVKKIIDNKTFNPKLFIYLAFSSSGEDLAILHAGRFYFNPTSGIEFYRANIIDKINYYLTLLRIKLYGGESSVDNFIYPGYSWLNIIYGDPLAIFDSEAFTLAGGYGLAFYVPGPRLYWGTPYDNYNVFQEMFRQNILDKENNFLIKSAMIIYMLVNDPGLDIPKINFRLYDTNYGGFSTVRGKIVIYNLSTGWYTPLSNAIVRLRVIASMPNSFGLGIYGGIPKIKHEIVEGYYSTMGAIINITDKNGEFVFYGLSPSALLGTDYLPSIEYRYLIEACIINSRGEIEYYTDLGVHRKDIEFTIKNPIERVNHVLFRCGSIVLYSIIEPEVLSIPKIFIIEVRDAASHMIPQFYGGTFYSILEGYPVFVIFSQPNIPTELFIKSRSPVTGEPRVLLILNNNSYGFRTRYGYMIHVNYTFLQIAQDMYNVNLARYSRLVREGIRSGEIEDYLDGVNTYIVEARKELLSKKYVSSFVLALEAWKMNRNIYRKLYYEVLNIRFSIIFVFILLIPFVYLFERLLFMYSNVKKQIFAMIFIAITVTLLLYFIHPAFRIMEDLFLLFLGILITVLTLPTISFLLFDFSSYLELFKRKISGPHFTGISRSGAIVAALSLGASMIRLRKIRSTLIFLTLVIIILGLIIFSFPAVTTGIVKRNTYLTPTYTGILIKDNLWRAIPQRVLDNINDILEKSGYQYSISLRTGLYPNNTIKINEENSFVSAFLGYSVEEDKISGISGLIIRGRWFNKTDYNVCILDNVAARYLNINVSNIAAGNEYILLSTGLKLRIIGIIDNKLFNNRIDLDGGNFTLIDRVGLAAGLKEERMTLFRYLPTSLIKGNSGYFILIVPSQLVLDLGGNIYSISLKIHAKNIFKTYEMIDDVAEKLAFKLDKNYFIYVTQPTLQKTFTVFRYLRSSIYISGNIAQLVIPISIGILILFNSMLSNVYERAKEIEIYSALGLSPYHVSGMFLAEAIIFSVVSSMLGYLVGIFLAKIINVFNLLPGVYLNFTVSIPIYSTLLSIIATLLASWYPVIRASKMVTPSFEREWKPKSKPKGDIWTINLPFVITTRREAKALLKFILEYLEQYKVRGKIFTTLSLDFIDKENKVLLQAELQMSPYELGIIQRITLSIIEERKDRYTFTLKMNRIEGPTRSWMRSSTIFVREIRKQFLIWRGLSLEEKRKYEQ